MLTWDQVCADPNLRDLPFKVEINAKGNLEMSPSKPRHGALQFKIGLLLAQQPGILEEGRIITECPIETRLGVRVPDLVWLSRRATTPSRRTTPSDPDPASGPERESDALSGSQTVLRRSPEICIEILSEHHTSDEMEEKRQLLAELGCEEFWTCTEAGELTFQDAPTGQNLSQSPRCPDFPTKVTV